MGSAGTGSAGGNTSRVGAVAGAVTAEVVGSGGDGEGDRQGGEVCVGREGDGGGVLDDGWGAVESSDRRLLDGRRRGDVGGGHGLGGRGADSGGHGGGASPG